MKNLIVTASVIVFCLTCVPRAESAQRATLTSPTEGSTLPGSTVTFQWTAGSGVTKYWLELGKDPGSHEYYDRDMGLSVSATVSGLPTNGSRIYARLWSLIAGKWEWDDYGFITSCPGTVCGIAAQMITPAPGSTLTASNVLFQWTGGTNVQKYWLHVGRSAGGFELFNQDQGTNLSITLTLPTDGTTLYVRLWSLIGATWQYYDYTYIAVNTGGGTTTVPAQMTTPAPASTLTSSTVTFQWTGGTGVSDYALEVGSSTNIDLYYNQVGLTGLSATVSNLPTNGTIVYVKLWSRIGGDWYFNGYTYTASSSASISAKAEMTTPAPSSTLTSSTVTFQWTGGSNVSQYWLEVGASEGMHDYYDHGLTGALGQTVSGLPTNGSTVYVRLWSMIGGAWQWNDYRYTASSGTGTAPAQMTTPAPSSTLTSSTVTFQWTGGTGASQYRLQVGTTAGGSNLYGADLGTSLSATVSNLPTNGSTIFVRLLSLISGTWQGIDYTYTATNGSGATAKAQMTTPAPSSTLTSSTVTFQWTGGTGVSQYWLEVAASEGGHDFYNQGLTSLSATVSSLPTNGSTVWVRLWSMINGAWQYNDYRYTASSTTASKAQMTTPPPSSTLTSSTVTFQWTGGTSVSQYWLEVGLTEGMHDFYNQGLTSLSATVSGLPTNGSTVYVRLWSMINGAWQHNDYIYTASQ
jgi:hypothetical protein